MDKKPIVVTKELNESMQTGKNQQYIEMVYQNLEKRMAEEKLKKKSDNQ